MKLRQSTASQEVVLGVFVDDTDGKTAETALTIANTDIKCWKMGATTLANKTSGGATHISGGIYYAVLDATDTDTLGGLILFVHVAGALPVRLECEVLTAVNYDATIAGTDLRDVSVTQVLGTAVSASAGLLNANVTTIAANAITAAATATDFTTEVTAATATAAALATAQTSLNTIAGYLDTEIGTLTTNLATANTNINTIDDFLDTEMAALTTNLATVAGYLDTEVAAILADTTNIKTRIPAALVSGRIDASVGAMAANVVTAAAAAADFGTEIAATVSGSVWESTTAGYVTAGSMGLALGTHATAASLATAQTSLNTIAGYLDTEVAAILADTTNIKTRIPAALVGGLMSSDVTAISADTAAADALELAFDNTAGSVAVLNIVDRGTAQSATSTTIVLRAAVAFADTELVGDLITVTSGTTGAGQTRSILAYASSTKTATVAAWTTTPTGTIGYQIVGAVAASGGTGLDAAATRAALGMASANLDTQIGTVTTNLATANAGIVTTNGYIDTEVGALTTNLATANAALVTIDGIVDAIVIDTVDLQARLPAALVGGRINANVAAVNNIAIDGAGTEGDPWGPS